MFTALETILRLRNFKLRHIIIRLDSHNNGKGLVISSEEGETPTTSAYLCTPERI